MASRITIAIIGAAGSEGRKIASMLSRPGVYLLLISENPFELELLVEGINQQFPDPVAEAVDCLKDACWEADVIILSVPLSEVLEVAARFKEVATQKIVMIIRETDGDLDEAFVADILPNSTIIYSPTSQVVAGLASALADERSGSRALRQTLGG